MGSILTLSKTWDVDARFAKEVSLNPRKGKMQMQLYMPGRLKSICKLKERQVADTLVPKRASTTANIKVVQIHQLSKKHLRQRISSLADTTVATKISTTLNKRDVQIHGASAYSVKLCFLIHQICDNVLRKNIGYEFL